MLKLCLFLILAVALILPEDADAWGWRRPRIRVRLPRLHLPRLRLRRWGFRIRLSRVIHAIKKTSGIYAIAKLLKPKMQQEPHQGDTNDDGIVDNSELATMLGSNVSAQDIASFRHFADKNPRNGILTMTELNAALKELGAA